MLTLTAMMFFVSGCQNAGDVSSTPWRRNEFESGGHRTGAKVGGGTDRMRSAGKIIFLVVPLHFFGFESTISLFGERLCDGQYNLVTFLFAVLLLTVPPPVPSHL